MLMVTAMPVLGRERTVACASRTLGLLYQVSGRLAHGLSAASWQLQDDGLYVSVPTYKPNDLAMAIKIEGLKLIQ
jgi:hypothetical protein